MGCPRAWGRVGVWRGSRAKFEGGPGGLKGFDIAGFFGDFEVADGFGPLNGGGFGEGAGVKAGLQGFVDAGAAAHGLPQKTLQVRSVSRSLATSSRYMGSSVQRVARMAHSSGPRVVVSALGRGSWNFWPVIL